MRKIKKIITLFDKPIILVVFCFLIFSPLLFLNIRHDHDWGGDFAQYLSQADNIAHFRAMDKTGYLYNEDYSMLGPKAYPPGFPLIIAPLTYFFGNQTTPYNYLLSFILIGCAILTVFLLKKKIGNLAAILLSFVIFYNPYFINLKSEIIADIPFTLFVLGFILLTFDNHETSLRKWIYAGILAGLAASSKSTGNTLFLALLVYSIQQLVVNWIKFKNFKKSIQIITPILIAIALGISLIFSLNLVFLHQIQASTGYLNSFNLGELSYKTIGDNIFYYSEILRTFFMEMKSTELWFGALFGSAVLTFFITGLIISFNKKPDIKEWITVIYFGILLIYPYQHSGFRFLIPIVPLIIYYASIGIVQLKPGKGGIVLVIIVAVIMMFQYKPQIRKIQDSVEIIQEGPYSPQVVSAFEKIMEFTTIDDVIVFNKPRVLYRYTQRKCMSHKPESTIIEMEKQFSVYNPNCFLLYSGLPDPSLEQYVIVNNEKLDLIWEDGFFKLFRKIENL